MLVIVSKPRAARSSWKRREKGGTIRVGNPKNILIKLSLNFFFLNKLSTHPAEDLWVGEVGVELQTKASK